MAALDFPSSPTLNQQYSNGTTTWAWDGTAWNIIPQMGPMFISDTPPPNPAVGQQWWRSTNGQLYIWFVDPTGPGQWVQAAGSAGSPGAWEQIAKSVITTPGQEVKFLDLAPFDRLRLLFHGYLSADSICYMQLSTDNGATWLGAAGTYFYDELRWSANAVASLASSSNAFQLSNGYPVWTAAGGQGFALNAEFDGFNKSRSTHVHFQTDFIRNTDNQTVGTEVAGYLGGTHNAIKIFCAGGITINGGDYLLEGTRG